MAPLWGESLMKMTGMAYLRRDILAWEIWKQGRQDINRYARNEAYWLDRHHKRTKRQWNKAPLTLDIKNDNDSNN